MSFITAEKANTFLDGNKLSFTDGSDLAAELQRAESLILSRLQAVYPDAAQTWTAPGSTPQLIQDVAGALCAAWRYATVYSEEAVSSSSFAVALERRALQILDGIASGSYVLADTTSAPETQVSSADYYPNDAADEDDPRAFSMGMKF